jgi:LytS/YehU family sensor histidine kinase
MLDRLGALFQRVQASTRRLEVSLEEELAMVRDYLAIEEARFRDRLRVHVEAAPGTGDCLVPPLVLQPLVENAVRHGISARSSAGRIDVRAWREDGRLHLSVADDGPGLGSPSPAEGTGVGLPNTRERLAQLYGAEQSLTLERPEAGGTRVHLVLPARVALDG